MTYQHHILARLLDFTGEEDFVHDGIYLMIIARESIAMGQYIPLPYLVKGKYKVEFANVLEEGICIRHNLVLGRMFLGRVVKNIPNTSTKR